MIVQPASASFGYPTLAVTVSKILAETYYLEGRVAYVFGGKANPIDQDESTLHGLDCSGFTRVALYHALMGSGAISGPSELTIPDGSVEQHEWVAELGFKISSDPGAEDGHLRWFFLPPIGDEPGHTGFIYAGETCECYGGHGVGRREWGSESWMSQTIVYVVA